MTSLQNSQDTDGSFEMDELEELLRDEEFEEKDSGSEGSEEIIYQHTGSPLQLSYKRKRYLQSLPTNSLVRQIVKRWQDEGSPLPFYLFWPWSFIRNFCYGVFLMGWLAITVAAFWPVFHMMFFPESCVDSDISRNTWLDGSILQTDLDPLINESLGICEDKAVLQSLKEYNVRFIYLASPAWWRGFLLTNESRSRGVADQIHQLSGACRIHGIKIMMGVFMSNSKGLLEVYHEKHIKVILSNATYTVDDQDSESGMEAEIFHSLIAAGIRGFYVEDSDKLSSNEVKELVNTFELVQDHCSTDIVFGINDNTEVSYPPVTVTGFDLNQMTFSSAANLSEWIDGRFVNDSQPSTLWKMSSTKTEDEGSEDSYAFNLRLLQTVLPGIPMLDSADFEGLANFASDKPNPMKLLLSLRKHSSALQEREFCLLEQYNHLERNVFAMLRTFEEEKRYLVLWNFSNSTVSLNFHMLSIEGRWVFRSVVAEYAAVVRMRNIENVQPFEFGVIELP